MSQKKVRARPRTLVDQFATARSCGVGAPFAVVAGASAVSIAAPDEHHLPQRAALKDLARLAECTMVAVVETDADQRPRAACGVRHRVKLGSPASPRLFDEDVLSGGRRFPCDRRQLIVDRGDEDRVDIAAAHSRLPVRGCLSACTGGELFRTVRLRVATNGHGSRWKGRGALTANQSAADDGRAHSCFWGQNAL
jgi:hypothetical protein